MLYIFLLPRAAVPIVLRAFGSALRQSSPLRLLHPEARASAAQKSAWRSACICSRQLVACSAGRLQGSVPADNVWAIFMQNGSSLLLGTG